MGKNQRGSQRKTDLIRKETAKLLNRPQKNQIVYERTMTLNRRNWTFRTKSSTDWYWSKLWNFRNLCIMRRQIKRERRKYLVNAWIHNDTNRLCQRSGTRNEWKVFLVTNENAEIRRIEQLMAENQNKNWNIIEEPFSTIGRNFHILSDCKQTLYSNQQLI